MSVIAETHESVGLRLFYFIICQEKSKFMDIPTLTTRGKVIVGGCVSYLHVQ